MPLSRPVPLFPGVYEVDDDTLLVVRAAAGPVPAGWKIVTTPRAELAVGGVVNAQSLWPAAIGQCELANHVGACVGVGIGDVAYRGEPREATVDHRMASYTGGAPRRGADGTATGPYKSPAHRIACRRPLGGGGWAGGCD